MKIEKYNQRLLAVLGTVGVIFLIVALFAFITVTILEHRRFDNYDDDGILSDEKIEELQKENKREQVISYEAPRLVDTLNSIYIIPVSHKTLDEKEDIDDVEGVLNLKSRASSSRGYKSDSRYSSRHYGEFNNLIVYNPTNKSTQQLFDKRINFNQIDVEYFADDILLLMQVAESDTHRDGVINLSDFKNLYIYSLKEKKMNKISIEGMDMFKYRFLNDSKDLIVLFGIDKNDDGQYENNIEPTVIKMYEYDNRKLVDIISDEMNDKLQKRLEGTIE